MLASPPSTNWKPKNWELHNGNQKDGKSKQQTQKLGSRNWKPTNRELQTGNSKLGSQNWKPKNWGDAWPRIKLPPRGPASQISRHNQRRQLGSQKQSEGLSHARAVVFHLMYTCHQNETGGIFSVWTQKEVVHDLHRCMVILRCRLPLDLEIPPRHPPLSHRMWGNTG